MTLSESKRSADDVEGLEKSDVKKPKLDSDTQDDQADDAEDEVAVPEETTDEPTTAMDVDKPSGSNSEPKIRFKKGKTAEGASAHFKENPYTFIDPTDPIITACS